MSFDLFLLVAIAGGLGAACRYAFDHAITQRISHRTLPWGTWLVNVTGSLALGFLGGMTLRVSTPVEIQLVIGGGFLGAYTTFSTWMYESLRLIEAGTGRAAALNLLGGAVSGGIAATAGFAAASALF